MSPAARTLEQRIADIIALDAALARNTAPRRVTDAFRRWGLDALVLAALVAAFAALLATTNLSSCPALCLALGVGLVCYAGVVAARVCFAIDRRRNEGWRPPADPQRSGARTPSCLLRQRSTG